MYHIEKSGKRNRKLEKCEKLGSLLGDKEDISRRKQLSRNAMNDLKKLWKKMVPAEPFYYCR